MQPNDAPSDEKVIKVLRAIRQVESQGNYNAIGDGGSSAGAFQWNNNKVPLKPGQVPARYWEHAKEAGVDVQDFSKASQNKVAYSIIKKWKDVDGLSPEEIAAKWNGATRGPDGRLTYVNPDYGVKFRNALSQNQGFSVPPPPEAQPFQPIQAQGLSNFRQEVATPTTFMGSLGQDFSRAGTGVQEALNKTRTGQIDPVSGVIQGAGAVAGTVGDVTDTAIRAIPVVGDVYGKVNDVIGGAVQGALNTETGQAISNSLSPNTKANIGAIANIASVVPFFKGLSALRKGASDTYTAARQGSIKNEAVNELEERLGSSQLANNLKEDGAVRRLVERGILPDVQEVGKDAFVYKVDEALDRVTEQMKDVVKKQDEIARAQDFKFRPTELGGYTKLDGNTRVSAPVQDSLEALKKHYDATYDQSGQLWLQQADIKLQRGEFTLDDIKELSRKVGQAKSAYLQTGDLSTAVPKQAWENLRRDLKDVMGERDTTGQLRQLDKKYSELAKEKKALIKLNNRRVVPKEEGFVKSALREVPLASRILPSKQRTATSRLRSRRPIRESGKKALVRLGIGTALANQQSSEQQK